MKLSFVFVALLFWTIEIHAKGLQEKEWATWKLQFGKSYGSLEKEEMRKEIWQTNRKFIENHSSNLKSSFKVKLNEFADQITSEMTNNRASKLQTGFCKSQTSLGPLTLGALPTSVDWREKGFVTPVVNQGEMGSSCILSAIGAMEVLCKKQTGLLLTLSTQMISDCCQEPRTVDQVFECVHNTGGIEGEQSYPSGKPGPCKFNPFLVAATVAGCVDVRAMDEAALQQAVATVGPVSAGIDASHPSFQSYSHGIYYEPACNSTTIDHDVLVVGYGESNGEQYWIVKNSWGKSWGEDGYVRMARGKNNNCGIATRASYPI